MKMLSAVVLAVLVAACGTQPLPDPGSEATVVTVTNQVPASITLRQGGHTTLLTPPGPITIVKGRLLQLDLQETHGLAPWTDPPIVSQPDVLSLISSKEMSGYRVVEFRGVKVGISKVAARFPCGDGGCAAVILYLQVIVAEG